METRPLDPSDGSVDGSSDGWLLVVSLLVGSVASDWSSPLKMLVTA